MVEEKGMMASCGLAPSIVGGFGARDRRLLLQCTRFQLCISPPVLYGSSNSTQSSASDGPSLITMQLTQWLMLPVLTLVLLLASPSEAQVESWLPLLKPDPYFDFAYYPMLIFILRTKELLQAVSGSYKGEHWASTLRAGAAFQGSFRYIISMWYWGVDNIPTCTYVYAVY